MLIVILLQESARKDDGKMEDIIAVVLAAGKGTRMKSDKAKVVHKIYGKEMIKRVVEIAKQARNR